MQRGINGRLFSIPSANLVTQLKDLAKRNGKAQTRQSKGQTRDDGCTALAMCCFGHQNLVDGTWLPKHDFQEKQLIDPKGANKKRGYMIDAPQKKILRYDERSNTFR